MPHDPTLERLANATLLVPFESLQAPRWILDGLADGISGVCLFHNNLESPEQVTALNASLSEAADTPLISLDEEGGDVTRIGQARGSDYPGNAALGAVDDTDLTRATLRALGAQLSGMGFNLDLAPSVDVNVADDNPVIGTRSFGADADLVARHAAASVQGQGVGRRRYFPARGRARCGRPILRHPGCPPRRPARIRRRAGARCARQARRCRSQESGEPAD